MSGYYPESTGSGYMCAICGTYVPYNTVHSCGGTAVLTPETYSVGPAPDRVALALERIAAALERLAEDAA